MELSEAQLHKTGPFWGIPFIITKNLFGFNEKLTQTIRWKYFNSTKIKSSSIGNRCIYLIEQIEYIMKIIKSLEKSGLLINGVSKKIQTEVKNKKRLDLSECY